ncbi:GNAT family N-acetyltransferase [Acidiphilium acidophilum]|uniref:GNAT family N-acetyltransferase n=1 Tax=Acidiphilium acidophilum TaxID=76588 RepID=A0AAW9DPY3_ACIAO|nr:GNAT family N-acetyltransferase [Acidiphilium acidophilum]MDX5930619.1 GNAT family N-acetyltransferase [Acidiphilium acidophilum]
MMGDIVAVSGVQCEAMAAVHRAAFGVEAWSAREIATLFATPLVFGFLSEAGGMVMARAVADEAEILTIGVVPAMRRQGLARGLLDRVIAEARCRAATTLFLEVAAGNAAARALYRSAGFEECGVRADYYGAGRDAVVLRRSLCE